MKMTECYSSHPQSEDSHLDQHLSYVIRPTTSSLSNESMKVIEGPFPDSILLLGNLVNSTLPNQELSCISKSWPAIYVLEMHK